jgi:mRNA interferase RelE/StbE
LYRVEATPQFREDLRRLDRTVVIRILGRIEWLAENANVLRTSLRNLPKDLKGLYKFRVGDYRVLLWVDRAGETLVLYGVAHRREIYKRLR